MAANNYVLPVVDLFKGNVRRQIVDYMVTSPEAEDWQRKSDIADIVDASGESVRQNIQPLLKYGILDVRDPDVEMPLYRRGETDVVVALQSWYEDSDVVLTELLGTTGCQNLVEFFLDHAEPDESYSKNAIHKEGSIDYESVMNNIDTLVEAGVVREVEGTRGIEYQLQESADVVQFLHTLNSLLVQTYQERSS